MEIISIILYTLFGIFFLFLRIKILAYIFFGIAVICVSGVLLQIKKHNGYKAWKDNQQIKNDKIMQELAEKKKKKISEVSDSIVETKLNVDDNFVESYAHEMYKKRREDSLNFEGLFYPELGNHELPTGFHNIPVQGYVVYDLETTGLTPTHDEILEIGAIRIINGEITGVFHEYVHPQQSISKKITEINGITNEKVENCRTINEVLPDFIEFTERLPMVAYNAEFDYSFIKESWFKISGKKFVRKHFCAMDVYKKYHKYIYLDKPISAKLSFAVREVLGSHYYDEFIKESHHALVDASATQFIFEIIGGIINKND